MAPRDTRCAVEFAHCNGHRKVSPLKLSAEHVPFPCSLRELVLDRYGESTGVGSHAHPMQLHELLEYLKNIDNFSLSPWVALAGQTEAIGDPATPSREQIAILRWLGKALEIWEKQSPVEGRVAAQLRRLKPLSAAIALTEPEFLRPGAHPLHQLLDSIQARAIGWQARLDRVGAILEQQVTKAVDDSRRWFDNPSTDLAAICAEFSAAAERDQARAQRMIQRVVETEAGKVKTAAAKQEAARMLNAALQKYLAPAEIGDFIKGPWYTSAQLLLLKFGADSEQWQKMSATTETLLDSFQSTEEADETRRQHIFAVVTQLPKEMRRWLLSLHHDTEAVNEAMGQVEFTHLRILRRQPLELQHILPIVVEGEHVISDEPLNPGAAKNWQVGQWFGVETGNDGTVRVQLVLKVEQSQQLLFSNLAGIKVLQLSFTEFNRLFTQDKVKALHSGASFSLCLAHAVGVDSVEVLNALASALAQTEPTATSEPAPPPPSKPATKPKLKPKSKSASKPDARLALKSEQLEQAETVPELELEPDLELELELELESGLELELERTLQTPPAPDIQAEAEAVEEIRDDHYALPYSDDEATTTVPGKRPTQDNRRPAGNKPQGLGFLIEQAEEIKARGGYTPNAPLAQARSAGITEDSPPELMPDSPNDQQHHAPERSINLPMGAWLGFHDGDTPLMARLAVYDLENDYYIFVNRQGVKIRQVSRLQLLHLIDNGLVDILETNSNFRDEVTEVRKKLDQ